MPDSINTLRLGDTGFNLGKTFQIQLALKFFCELGQRIKSNAARPLNQNSVQRKRRAALLRQQQCTIIRVMRILLIVILVLTGCSGDGDWDMVSKRDIPSPDGQHVATVFEMTGYNTTGYEPQVSLLRPGQKPGKVGNVLRGGPGDSFTAQWTSSSNLVVEYHPDNEWISYPPDSTNMNGVIIEFRKR